MPTITDIFVGPKLKIKRAGEHIDDLRRLTIPLSRDFYSLKLRQSYGTAVEINAPGFTLSYIPTHPIDKILAVIIGDIIHNLYCALEHLAYAIVKEWHPDRGNAGFEKGTLNAIHFPMSIDRKSLEESARKSPLEQALPGFAKLLLEEIRPDKGRDERFWHINQFHKIDKHRMIIPTVTVTRVDNLNITFGTSRMSHAAAEGDATRPINIFSSSIPMPINNDFRVLCNVTFDKSGIFAGEAVVPTLTQMSQVISEAIASVERHTHDVKKP